jgi:hypothetical protein
MSDSPLLKASPQLFLQLGQLCALHLVAQYSESLELLEDVSQIDHKMTKMVSEIEDTGAEITPFGFLYNRLHFPTFDAMGSCIIEVDSSVEVFFDGMHCHFELCTNCLHQDISPGSRGAKSLILLGTLLDANPIVAEYDDSRIFHEACTHLNGELGISVLLLLLSKNGTGVKAFNNGNLPIHCAAYSSCLEVLKFLHKAYPESISMLSNYGSSLLYFAAFDNISDIADMIGKMQYI